MNGMIARTEQAITNYDSALLDNLDLDDAVKMIIGRLAKEKQRAEAAEARVSELEHDIDVDDWHAAFVGEQARAAQAERQNEIYAAELDALAQRELRIRIERDELRHKLNEAMGIARGFVAERDEARKQLEQAQADYERMKEERDNLRMSIVNNVSA